MGGVREDGKEGVRGEGWVWEGRVKGEKKGWVGGRIGMK